MTKQASLDDYEAVFQALLGRSLGQEEHTEITTRIQNQQIGSLVDLLGGVLKSDEFFSRHRESFAQRLFPETCVVFAKTQFGDELLVDLRQFHLGFAIATGHFEPAETAFVQRFVKRGYRVLDIGANIGYFTTAFARLVGNSGLVHAFEPVGESYLKLNAAVQRNGYQNIVTTYQLALSNVEGHVEMVFEKTPTNIGGAHFSRQTYDAQNLCFERVATKRLDDVFGRMPVDFVKIDVEGAEWLVLQGGDTVFRNQRPVMMIEFNAAQLENVSQVSAGFLLNNLMELGFHPYEILPDGNVRALADAAMELHSALARTGVANLAFAKDPL